MPVRQTETGPAVKSEGMPQPLIQTNPGAAIASAVSAGSPHAFIVQTNPGAAIASAVSAGSPHAFIVRLELLHQTLVQYHVLPRFC